MSPSWNESLRVFLAPARVGLVRLNHGWRPRMLEGHMWPSPSTPAGQPPWASALAAFSEGLGEMSGLGRNKPGAEVTVVLSNHFVRYLLVPQNDALSGEDEVIAHARHCFAQVYGNLAESWDIRLSSSKGGPQLACAVDAELLAGLDRAVAASGHQLVSVQPYLMAAFNRWRMKLGEPLVWFVLAEPDRLCLVALQNGRWHQILNLQTDAGWARALPDLLSRQRKLSGIDDSLGKIYLFAPDETAEQALLECGEAVQGLHLSPLPQAELSPEEAACYVMAMNG